MSELTRIDIQGIDEVRSALKETPLQAARAAKRAVRQTSDWAQSQVVKDMAGKTGIAQKTFRDWRVKSRGIGGADRLVWGGYNSLGARYVAGDGELERQLPPNEYDWGAKAGKFVFEGAIAWRMRSGYIGIFKRDGRRLVEQRVDIPEMQTVAELIRDQSGSRLTDAFAHEMRYEMSKGA